MPALALAGKDLRLLLRDRVGLFFTLGFPLALALFMGTLFGDPDGSQPIAILVVDEDGTEASADLSARLSASADLDVESAGADDARSRVRRGERTAFVVIPAGYGDARRTAPWGPAPRLEVGIDPSRRAERAMLRGVLTRVSVEAMEGDFAPDRMRPKLEALRRDLAADPDVELAEKLRLDLFLGAVDSFLEKAPGDGPEEGFRMEPLALDVTAVERERRGPRSAYEVTFPQGILWGLMSSAFAFALTFVNERSRGTLVRLRMAPLGRTEILAGKAIACFATTVAVEVVLLAIGILALGVRPGSYPHLAMAVGASAVAFVGIMMVLAVLGRTEAQVNGLGWSVLIMMAMVGGGMVPLFMLPDWVQAVGVVSPCRWAVLALEGAIWRGSSTAEMALPCGVLVAIGVVGFAIGARLFAWEAD